ncbi:MAG: 3-deoxy-D-manno-octulosonic acid kinase [Gammaproteobacteria bacterium]|nr:3-deoxy-D-manno-octulosonic acid kinase [Gammaproteobacteria bacterium]MYF68261.1 3-deoxy-D-manno-octulosonic acid kinase [Gammaproteobacteria bacterium]MYK38022.1 3-deoxy-D-manno-octulosonic acid kinase [Gammaproteobacteria bacterium]
MADKRITHRLRGGLDMLEEIRTAGKDRILHEAQVAGTVTPEWFEHGFWHQRQQWTAVSGGRGAGGRIGEDGKWFLRHYLRGGKAALFSRDRYLFLGTRRVRSFAEFRLLASMHEAGLPVPRPIAAHFRRRGITYSANLITEWIEGARSLSRALRERKDALEIMGRVGAIAARFHRAGICHADLNANNILIGPDGGVWLVDFDRARRRSPGGWPNARLRRLKRSLEKLGLYDHRAFQFLCERHDRTLAGT